MTSKAIQEKKIVRYNKGLLNEVKDFIAVEEPLEIRLEFSPLGLKKQREQKSLSITMRTPGSDIELAAGFLFTEGIISEKKQIKNIDFCGPTVGKSKLKNTIKVELKHSVNVDLKRLERHFYTTSSCGVCGKTSLEALYVQGQKPIQDDQFIVKGESLYQLTNALHKAQKNFQITGGMHASMAFDSQGNLLDIKEDVGRHNALDKLIGGRLLTQENTEESYGIMVSGRASFELLQKAMMARSPMLIAVGAPSSLAIELAQSFNLTLVGFLKKEQFNIYTGAERIS